MSTRLWSLEEKMGGVLCCGVIQLEFSGSLVSDDDGRVAPQACDSIFYFRAYGSLGENGVGFESAGLVLVFLEHLIAELINSQDE